MRSEHWIPPHRNSQSKRDKARKQEVSQALMNVVTRAPSNILNMYTTQQFRCHQNEDLKLSAIIFTFFALREQTQHVNNGSRFSAKLRRGTCFVCFPCIAHTSIKNFSRNDDFEIRNFLCLDNTVCKLLYFLFHFQSHYSLNISTPALILLCSKVSVSSCLLLRI